MSCCGRGYNASAKYGCGNTDVICRQCRLCARDAAFSGMACWKDHTAEIAKKKQSDKNIIAGRIQAKATRVANKLIAKDKKDTDKGTDKGDKDKVEERRKSQRVSKMT